MTPSGQVLWQQVLPPGQGYAWPHAFPWEGRDGLGQPLANGSYVYQISVESKGRLSHKFSTLIILK